MGSTNFGNQIQTVQFYAPAQSLVVNRKETEVQERGIFKGGYCTYVGNTVTISPLVCVIGDDDYTLRIKTQISVAIVAAIATPYIVLRWTYAATANNYMDFLAVGSGSILANDLIICKCNFVAGNISGIEYGDVSYPRSTPNVQSMFLKVEPSSPASMSVRVRGGRTTYGASSLEIKDQAVGPFSVPVGNPRKDLIYIDTDGTIKTSTGSEAVSPVAPSYSGKVVLAELTLAVGMSTIVVSNIKDVRAFLGSNAGTFLALQDTPLSYAGKGGYDVKVNSGATALEFVAPIAAIPSGGIIMWSGSIASIPSGWYLCDGNNGTPNLKDKFIVGAGGSYAVGATGGEAHHTLVGAELPAHTHEVPQRSIPGGPDGSAYTTATYQTDRTNQTDVTTAFGGGAGHENRPPYYALCFIMKA